MMLENYPLVTQSLHAAGRAWEIACVTDQDALMAQVQTDDDLANFPFGVLLWASAHALALRLAEEPALVAGKRVLELGAGVGYVGLVAAHLGATEVVQTDYHEGCLALCRQNIVCNGVQNVRVERGDWRTWPSELHGFDLVLGTDILYERSLHPALTALLPQLGKTLLLADPIRPAALEFVEQREAEGWTVRTEPRRLTWIDGEKDTMLLWLTPP